MGVQLGSSSQVEELIRLRQQFLDALSKFSRELGTLEGVTVFGRFGDRSELRPAWQLRSFFQVLVGPNSSGVLPGLSVHYLTDFQEYIGELHRELADLELESGDALGDLRNFRAIKPVRLAAGEALDALQLVEPHGLDVVFPTGDGVVLM